MHTMIRIRNVPESLHRRLKARAAIEGTSMSRYILRKIEKALKRPSRRELIEAIRSQPEVALDPSPADVLREERDSRFQRLQLPGPASDKDRRSPGKLTGLPWSVFSVTLTFPTSRTAGTTPGGRSAGGRAG